MEATLARSVRLGTLGHPRKRGNENENIEQNTGRRLHLCNTIHAMLKHDSLSMPPVFM